MSDSKSAPQITLESITTRKSHIKSGKFNDLSWPRLTKIDLWRSRMSVNSEYYLAQHIHSHITSENTDVRKLQALDALREANSAWHHSSYDVIGHGSWGSELWNFQARRQRDGRKGNLWQILWQSASKSASYSRKNHRKRGGCIINFTPVPAGLNRRI